MNTTMNQKYQNSSECIYSKNTFKDQILFFISHNIFKQNILLNNSRSLVNKPSFVPIFVYDP